MARINYFEIESDSEDELPAVEELFISTRKSDGNAEPAVSDTSPEPSDKENEGPSSQQQQKKDQAQHTRPRLSTASRAPLAEVTDDSLSEIFERSPVPPSSLSKSEDSERRESSKLGLEKQKQKQDEKQEELNSHGKGHSRFFSDTNDFEHASDDELEENTHERKKDEENVNFEDNYGDDEDENENENEDGESCDTMEEDEENEMGPNDESDAVAEDENDEDEDEDEDDGDISIPIRRKSRARAPQIVLESDEEDEDDIIPSKPLEIASQPRRILSQEIADDSSLFFDACSHKSNDSAAEEENNNDKDDDKEEANWESSDNEDFADTADITDASLSDDFINDDSDEEVESEGWKSDEEDEILEYSPGRTNIIDLVSAPGTPNASTIIATDLSSTLTASDGYAMSRRKFKRVRETYAQNYLDHMEDLVNHGLIHLLTGGGVSLKWSNKLRTTAGRARAGRKGPYDGALCDITVRFDPSNNTKYYATIELNEKVIDNPQRLADTLAHEYAHICEMLIDQRGGPYPVGGKHHGRGFKKWGKKITDAMDLEMVGRCHAYELHYKFEWQCKGCKRSVGRQSKSIDPNIHQCGHCRGMLIQTRPADNNGSEYNKFTRENYRSIKDSMGPSATFAEVNQELSRLWQLKKQDSKQDQEGRTEPEVIEILE